MKKNKFAHVVDMVQAVTERAGIPLYTSRDAITGRVIITSPVEGIGFRCNQKNMVTLSPIPAHFAQQLRKLMDDIAVAIREMDEVHQGVVDQE